MLNLDRRNDVIRAASAGLGAPAALAIAGWPGGTVVPASIALLGALVGLLLAFGFEHAIDRRAEINELRERVRTLEREAANTQKLNKLLEHQARLAKAEADINAIGMQVFSGAFTEAQQTGHFLPVNAILARMQVMQQAKGLDKPIPPPEGI